jgi:hypothetical protein
VVALGVGLALAALDGAFTEVWAASTADDGVGVTPVDSLLPREGSVLTVEIRAAAPRPAVVVDPGITAQTITMQRATPTPPASASTVVRCAAVGSSAPTVAAASGRPCSRTYGGADGSRLAERPFFATRSGR